MHHDHGLRELFAFLAVIAFATTAAYAFGWLHHPVSVEKVFGGFLVGMVCVELARWP